MVIIGISISPNCPAIAGSDGGNGHENYKPRVALLSKNAVLPAIDARGAVFSFAQKASPLRDYGGRDGGTSLRDGPTGERILLLSPTNHYSYSENQMIERNNTKVGEESDKPGWLAIAAKPLICAVLLGIAAVSLVRTNVDSLFPVIPPPIPKSTAESFLRAVRDGDEKSALLLAASIIPDDAPKMPRADYIRLMLQNQLGTSLLTSPFNHFDFLRWKDAILAGDIAKNCMESKKERSYYEEIFRTLYEKVKIIPPSSKKGIACSATLSEIWNSGRASGPEWIRLFSEVVFQSGADVMVVSLFNDEYQVVHAVCEVHGTDGAKCVADPLKGRFWKGVSVADLACDDSRTDGVWSTDERASLKRRAYRIPAEPMDYRLFEQRLNEKMSSLTPETPSFRFGIDPEARIDRYVKNFTDKNNQERFSYWHFPFLSLKSSKAFPTDWIAPEITIQKFGDKK